MASPFEIFRKNQRIFMAGAVLLAMFAFVIAPMFDGMRDSSGGGFLRSSPVIAAWKGGAISNDQAQMDEMDLQIANRFLSELARAVMQKGGMPQVPAFSPDLSMLGISGDLDTRTAAFRRMLITEAQNTGIRFDDDSVKVFLEKFVNGKLGGEAIVAILKQSTDRRMTMTYFNRVMRDELAYQHMLRLTNAGMIFEDLRDSRPVAAPILASPSKNWREFLRLNRKAKVQAYPVYVKDLLADVTTTPSDKELKDLYAKGKDIIRNANLLESEPAFMTPPKAEIEFLTIDTEALIVAEMAKIPEEELRKEYERRVANKQFQVPIEAPKSDATGLPLPESTPAAPSETPAATTEPPATTPPVAETPPTGEPPTTEPPAVAPPTSEPPTGEPPKTEPPAGGDNGANKQSLLKTKNESVRLVSYQEPGSQPPATTDPVAATQTEPNNPLRNPGTTTETTPPAEETKPAETKPAETATEPEATATPVNPGLSIGDATTPGPESQATETTTVPMRTQTFDEVKDQIAREMATGTAISFAEERINQAISVMTIYSGELEGYKRAQEEKLKGFTLPERPNLKVIADELGLDYGTTGIVDADSIQLMPIGQSSVSQGQRAQPIPVTAYINVTQGPGGEFVPLASIGGGASPSRFAFWKTKVETPVVPSFETVKEQIVDVWKLQQAIKLAESKAKELATQVGTGNLVDALTTDEQKKLVVEPAPFSAMNPMFPMFMQMNMQFQIDEVSRVDPLLPVDNQFMDGVFSTKVGEAVAAPDRRRSVYYVVKVLELSPSDDELLKTFMQNPSQNVNSLGYRDIQQARSSLFDALEKRLDFRFY
ncbi:MAG: hypothetical protein MUC43_15210 [Pirellula sp.]|nr:hypothetical protein [Pirellula sp.]